MHTQAQKRFDEDYRILRKTVIADDHKLTAKTLERSRRWIRARGECAAAQAAREAVIHNYFQLTRQFKEDMDLRLFITNQVLPMKEEEE